MKRRRPAPLAVAGLTLFLVAAACGSTDGADEARAEIPTLTVSRGSITVDRVPARAGPATAVTAGDRVVADETGVGLIHVPGIVELELFGLADTEVPRRPAGGEPLTVRHRVGHIRAQMLERSASDVIIDLGRRQLVMRSPGTEFVACLDPEGKTCLLVLNGAVEWQGDGDPQTFTTGQATFARPNDPPRLRVCMSTATYASWIADATNGARDGTLLQLVDKHSDLACEPSRTTTTNTSTTEAPTTTTPEREVLLPRAEGMIHLAKENPTIGTSSPEPGPGYAEARTIEGTYSFYVDRRGATNQEFRAWLQQVAGDDAEIWRQLAPDAWLERAGDAATQADYLDGESGLPVVGVRFDAALAYCGFNNKRLLTEVEWELAALNDAFEDLNQQRRDWVTNWDDYGIGVQAGQAVQRGLDATERPDPYYRLFAQVADEFQVARKLAGVRCAADEVADPQDVDTVRDALVDEQFDRTTNAWPEEQTPTFRVGFHSPSDYHLEASTRHIQLAVLQPIPETAASTLTIATRARVETIEGGPGSYRFGLIVGSTETGFALATIQPSPDGADSRVCIGPVSADLAEQISASDGYASAPPAESRALRHAGEDCEDGWGSADVPVGDIGSYMTLTLTISGTELSVSVDGSPATSVTYEGQIEAYGFYTETFHMDRTHIHYDSITLTSP